MEAGQKEGVVNILGLSSVAMACFPGTDLAGVGWGCKGGGVFGHGHLFPSVLTFWRFNFGDVQSPRPLGHFH